MKPIISSIAIGAIAILASCNNSAVTQQEAALQAKQKTIDSLQIALTRQHIIDSMSLVAEKEKEAAKTVRYTAVAPKKVKRKAPTRTQSSSYAQNTVQTYTGNSVTPEPVVYREPVAEPQKRGWSAKAKGAVIGTAAGAAAGAMINKRNRTAGAVIGGVLGAGAGTGIGAVIDNKNGR